MTEEIVCVCNHKRDEHLYLSLRNKVSTDFCTGCFVAPHPEVIMNHKFIPLTGINLYKKLVREKNNV